ncbi:MAG TPA: endolytic transglycosylase MltG [Steroidobacteraceae bacterium]|nr:endolytic transglycosylase MltG [Steroidobacteraceae bacterium]
MRKVTIALILLVLIVAGGAAGGYYWIQYAFFAPGPSRTPVRVQVDPGTSVRSVLTHLAGQGALANLRAVELYLRIHGRRPNVHFGLYEIPAGASAAQILQQFEEGRVVLEQITVVEGSTFADFRRELDENPDVTHTLKDKSPDELMKAIGHPDEHPEGRFFPDTYKFAGKTSDRDILVVAYNAMQKLVASAWAGRSPDLPFETPYQAIILASVIEKETGLPAERPLIAGVFVNRLRKGMRLQSDPTVIYGLGPSYDGTVHSRDLTTDTPYNSYTRAGLPPTPIALPGRESILAALHPQETGDLYFVATASGDGGHHFSKTLEEHNAAVKDYLSRLRQSAGAR